MRIFTVTHRGEPFAILRARDAVEAIEIVRTIGAKERRCNGEGLFAAREPNDAEMVDWLTRPEDRLLAGDGDCAIAPLHAG
jgi:hypothetical protein